MWLSSLSAWVAQADYAGADDTPARQALRALRRAHGEQLPTEGRAYAEALDVLRRCRELGDFERWRASHKGHAGGWPSAAAPEYRRGLRAV